MRQNVERGDGLRARNFARGDEQIEECRGKFRERLGGGVAIGDEDERALGGLPEKHRVQCFRGCGETGEGNLRVAIAQQLADGFLERGVAAQALKQISDCGVRHGFWRALSMTRSMMAVVE